MAMDDHIQDAQRIRSYLSGDPKAFEALYRKYERPLFSFILKLVRNRESAEDIFQQTWIKVIRALPGYREKGRFSSWIFGIGYHCFIDAVRKNKIRNWEDASSERGSDRIGDDSMNPETLFIMRERQRWLEESIQELPEDQKQILLLRIVADMPFKEIARLLECPLNTVLGRMHYAMKNLQKMKNRKWKEVSGDGL